MAGAREPSMEDILASIKRVIAEEKEIRAARPAARARSRSGTRTMCWSSTRAWSRAAADPVDLGPPLLEEEAPTKAGRGSSSWPASPRAAPPPPQVNPLEEMVREMLRPILKQWLDDHLPNIVDEHVKREIHRITGRPL